MNKIVLRNIQQEAVDSVFNKKYKQGIVCCPVAGGKSIVVAEIASRLKGRIVVFQPNKEILMQNFEKYKMYDSDAAIYSASMNSKEVARVTFATIQSVMNNQQDFQDIEGIVIDECHLVSSGGLYSQFIETQKSCKKVVGLTATPFRLENGELKMMTRIRGGVFSKFFYITQPQEMVKKGYWAKTNYVYDYEYDRKSLEQNSTSKDFREVDIEELNLRSNIVEKVEYIIENCHKKHILVFLTTLKECSVFTKTLQEKGVSCDMVSSKNTKEERDNAIKNFTTGKTRVLFNVGILTTGFDFPALDCIILCRPTKSLSLFYQMIGRGVRLFENKVCDIYDLCGNVKEFGKIEDLKFSSVEGDDKGVGLENENGFIIRPPQSYFDTFGIKVGLECEKEKARLRMLESTMMPSGKYKGYILKDIPEWYLQFLINQQNVYNYTKKMTDVLDLGKQYLTLSKKARTNVYEDKSIDAKFR